MLCLARETINTAPSEWVATKYRDNTIRACLLVPIAGRKQNREAWSLTQSVFWFAWWHLYATVSFEAVKNAAEKLVVRLVPEFNRFLLSSVCSLSWSLRTWTATFPDAQACTVWQQEPQQRRQLWALLRRYTKGSWNERLREYRP